MNWDMNAEEFYDMDEGDFDNELKKLKPCDFYFQLGYYSYDGVSNDHYFTVVPKPYYDANKCQSDFELEHLNIMPQGFGEDAESSFSYDGDPKIGRQLLLQAGFIEKKMF